MIKISNIDHVVIRAKDIPKMIAFYRDVLGCPEERRNEDMGLYQMRAGSALIDLVDVNGKLGKMGGAAPGDDACNMDHFCVRVEPFDEDVIRAHLAKHQIDAPEKVMRYGAEGTGPSIYIQDPEGNTVELKGPAGE
ncbi:MAG: VOC family protein [Rhodospirillales bacterium]